MAPPRNVVPRQGRSALSEPMRVDSPAARITPQKLGARIAGSVALSVGQSISYFSEGNRCRCRQIRCNRKPAGWDNRKADRLTGPKDQQADRPKHRQAERLTN